MKIGILTQPLRANYGGVLQNWALQQVLLKLGHEPITIDLQPRILLKDYIIENIKGLIAYVLIPSRRRPYLKLKFSRPSIFDQFIREHIILTKPTSTYSRRLLNKYFMDALIVGSDQVWRPRYNETCQTDMFLKFVGSYKCKRVSYAASFGTEEWEYDEKMACECAQLIKHFDAVSVREPSAINLCKDHFGITPKQVLDPTLLLDKDEYIDLIKDTKPLCGEPFMAAYILSPSEETTKKLTKIANEKNLRLVNFAADSNATLTVEQWISMFRDAEYIATDSFHGSVFSLIFQKDFEFFCNEDRGNTRFEVIKNLQKNGNINDLRDASLSYLKDSLK